MTLPTDAKARKALPLFTFMMNYFPDAWLAVVEVAVAGNDQHNPGEKLHWAREKSTDQMDCAWRHTFDYGRGTFFDTDGQRHLAKAAWRILAQLQLDIEHDQSMSAEFPPAEPMNEQEARLRAEGKPWIDKQQRLHE